MIGGRGVVVVPALRFELAVGELTGVVLHESWERGGHRYDVRLQRCHTCSQWVRGALYRAVDRMCRVYGGRNVPFPSL